jgi:hypothetical protein
MAMDKKREDEWLASILKDDYQDILATEDCFELPFKENRVRYFSYDHYSDDGGYIETVSEEEVRANYWPHWYAKMCEKYEQAYVDEHYSFEDCLDDWVIIHHAWPSEVGKVEVKHEGGDSK